jgi:hypothetical protein
MTARVPNGVRVWEHVIDERDVEVEHASVVGLELAGLELNDDVAR